MPMTYSLAMAAAQDHANRRMRSEGRKKWNQEDWNAMCEKFDALYPIEEHAAQMGWSR